MTGWAERISIVLLISVVLVFVVIGVDFVSGRSQHGMASVIDKYYKPKHNETHYDPSLKIPLTLSVDDEWFVVLQKGDNVAKSKVAKPIYETILKGQKVQIDYRLGIFSGKMYVEKVSLNASP